VRAPVRACNDGKGRCAGLDRGARVPQPPIELRVVDFDRVEAKNLAAQWFVKQSVGKTKAEAIRLQLANFYGVRAEAFGVRLAAGNAAQLLAGCALAVDCFDNADSRIALADAARAAGVPLVHAALAGDGAFGLVAGTSGSSPTARTPPARRPASAASTCR
jgi:molybdopterin/thiamine biosynthesis adenylyltransferase